MILAYSLLLSLALVLGSPWWLFRMFTSGRYRTGLAQRLGLIPASLRVQLPLRHTVWIHAVSVGELLAVSHLIPELRQAFPNHAIALSTTTATGQRLAQQRFPDLPVFFYPLDFAFSTRAWLRAVQPDLLLLVESELWPRMLHECRRANVHVAVVNARMSDRSFRRTLPFRRLWLRMASHVDLFLAQGEETASRLQTLGIPPSHIQITGNLKYDALSTRERDDQSNAMTRRLLSLQSGSRLIVCGSTHAGEEAILLHAWPALHKAVPDAVLVFAPRHPERFAEVEELLRATRVPYHRCSRLLTAAEPLVGGTLLLLDTVGDLASLYSIASVAFIGGSLVPRGGHNPLEAARFAIPVLMGTSYENFREIVTQLFAAHAIQIVKEPSLAPALIQAMQTPANPKHLTGVSGATGRTVEALKAFLAENR